VEEGGSAMTRTPFWSMNVPRRFVRNTRKRIGSIVDLPSPRVPQNLNARPIVTYMRRLTQIEAEGKKGREPGLVLENDGAIWWNRLRKGSKMHSIMRLSRVVKKHPQRRDEFHRIEAIPYACAR